MSKRGRIAAYGSSVALVLAGALCAALVGGMAGEILAMAMIGSGLVILTGLVFMEVGLSEDRERAREDRERERKDREHEVRRGPATTVPRRRLEPVRPPRLRGHRHER